jgi:hypothetical protein
MQKRMLLCIMRKPAMRILAVLLFGTFPYIRINKDGETKTDRLR